MIPELVTIHTSLITDLGDAVRERFGVSGDLTIEEMTELVRLIPSQYQRIDYIQTSGTQYINTGLHKYDFADVELDFQATQLNTSNLCGMFVRSYYASDSFSFGVRANNNFALQFPCTSGNSLIENGQADLNRHTIKASTLDQKFYVDGNAVSVSNITTTRSSDTTHPFYIGARYHNEQGVEPYCYHKIYEFKAWGWGGQIIMDLLPVIRKSDSVAGMYDIINGQFYTNAGTGSFITP